jgi:hypothetical protein
MIPLVCGSLDLKLPLMMARLSQDDNGASCHIVICLNFDFL